MVEMMDKSDMEMAIMTENESKYWQTSSMPFVQNPLLQDFGYLGIGHHAEAVIQGNYQVPPGVDPYTTRFIEQLWMEPAIANSRLINIYFTTKEWKSGWQKIKENTATGSDFIHFGHF